MNRYFFICLFSALFISFGSCKEPEVIDVCDEGLTTGCIRCCDHTYYSKFCLGDSVINVYEKSTKTIKHSYNVKKYNLNSLDTFERFYKLKGPSGSVCKRG